MAEFLLTCESTIDLPYSWAQERGIPVIFYTYMVNGEEKEDDMQRTPGASTAFWQMEEQGTIPTTSQINQARFEEFFRSLPEDQDILHLSLSSGITGTVHNARLAAQTLMEENPGRTIRVIDSLCASGGYGLFTAMVWDWTASGLSLEETVRRAEEASLHVHHQFFTTDLKYFRRTGRVSGAASAVAAVLNLCPLMQVSRDGHLKAYSKVRGKKAAREAVLKWMEEHAENGKNYDGKCVINHSYLPEEAKLLKEEVEERFPNLRGKIIMTEIGAVISAHAGPGTAVVYFYGDLRPEGGN